MHESAVRVQLATEPVSPITCSLASVSYHNRPKSLALDVFRSMSHVTRRGAARIAMHGACVGVT